jgi:hypothetical protein
MNNDYKIAMGYPWYFCKWWRRIRKCDEYSLPLETSVKIINKEGERIFKMDVMEFYTPWWAWPFELLHRAIFGNSKFIK